MIRFKVKADALNKVLDVITIVDPQDATKQGMTGYLFVIRAGGTRCDIYSQGQNMVSRAVLAISDVEGEGAFVYPPSFSQVFRHLVDEEEITFEAGDRDGNYYVNYETTSGSVAERPSINPALLKAPEEPEAKDSDPQFPALLLKRAIDTVKADMADLSDTKVHDACKGIQIFDASKPDFAAGNGTVFASDGQRGSYFYCEAFKDKGMLLHGSHLPKIVDFLGKCSGNITFRAGENRSYFADENGRMIGWGHYAKTYPRFSYYEEEKIQFDLDGAYLARTLNYMVAAIGDTKNKKVRVVFEPPAENSKFGTLQIFSDEKSGKVSSPLINVTPITEESKVKIATVVGVKHLIDLFGPLTCPQVRLKVRINPSEPAKMHFRVKEDFTMDLNGKVLIGKEGGLQCQVTRFIPNQPKG